MNTTCYAQIRSLFIWVAIVFDICLNKSLDKQTITITTLFAFNAVNGPRLTINLPK